MNADGDGAVRRLSDWLHPIVVRDIIGTLRSRVYLVTLAISCVAVLGIAMGLVEREATGRESSDWVLETTLRCVLPIVWFIVPIQAFGALRDEVASGTADALVLTDLRPFNITVGILLSSVLQATLFLAVFAPLIALSYQLLAIDVFTLLQIAWLVPLGSVAMTALALACLALMRFAVLREHLTLITMVVVGVIPAVAVLELPRWILVLEAVVRRPDFGIAALQQISMLCFVSTALCMVAASRLTQFQEARATAFRVLGLVGAPVLTLWSGGGTQAAVIWTLPFWYLAVTDPPKLTRRQRVLVPLGRRAAVRAFPFLPGAARGWVYSFLIAIAVAMTGVLTHLLRDVPAMSPWMALAVTLRASLSIVMLAGVYLYLRCTKFDSNALATTAARLRLLPLTLLYLMLVSIFDWIVATNVLRGVFPLAPINPTAPFGAYPPLTMLVVQSLVVLGIARANRRFVRAEWREVVQLAGENP